MIVIQDWLTLKLNLFLEELEAEAMIQKDTYSVKLSDIEKYKELKKKNGEFKKDVIFTLIDYKNKYYDEQSKTSFLRLKCMVGVYYNKEEIQVQGSKTSKNLG